MNNSHQSNKKMLEIQYVNVFNQDSRSQTLPSKTLKQCNSQFNNVIDSIAKKNYVIEKLEIVSWNVNSIRTRQAFFLKFLQKRNPDIILLQEIRCVNEQFPSELVNALGYNVVLNCQKGRNGVAILSKYPMEDIITDLPKNPYSNDSRYIEATIIIGEKRLKIASVYTPHGTGVSVKDNLKAKLKFLDALMRRVKTLKPKKHLIIIGGDYNIDPDKNTNIIGSTSTFEKEKFQQLLELGLFDSFKTLHPDKKIKTTKASNLRLDHFLVSKKVLTKMRKIWLYPQSKKETRKSKHNPLICKLSWKRYTKTFVENNSEGISLL